MVYLYKIIQHDNKPQLKKFLSINDLNNLVGNFEIDEEDIITILKDKLWLDVLFYEEYYCVALNEDKVVGILQISNGNRKEVQQYNDKIGTFLLLIGATEFIVLHNHPNDAITGSEDDYESWGNLIALGNQFNIEMKGDYVIGKSGWMKLGEEIQRKYNNY